MSEGPQRPTISLRQNGSLRVEGLTRFTNSRGEPIATKKVMSLCRCGASKNKPFCDSTHKSIGWEDAKSADRVPDQLDTYAGREQTILDNRGICAHAGFCTTGLPAVWRTGVEPWIDPDGAPADEAQRVIRQCPSGALSYVQDGNTKNAFSDTPEIQVSKNGPYHVRGGVELQDVTFGQVASREHYALCRCGHSRNKPFCDGTHWYAGFRDDEAKGYI